MKWTKRKSNHVSPRRAWYPACTWFLAQCEWNLNFSINALSGLLRSSCRREQKPTKPLKEQLQEHRNASNHPPVRDDGWLNSPVSGSSLPVSWAGIQEEWNISTDTSLKHITTYPLFVAVKWKHLSSLNFILNPTKIWCNRSIMCLYPFTAAEMYRNAQTGGRQQGRETWEWRQQEWKWRQLFSTSNPV